MIWNKSKLHKTQLILPYLSSMSYQVLVPYRLYARLSSKYRRTAKLIVGT